MRLGSADVSGLPPSIQLARTEECQRRCVNVVLSAVRDSFELLTSCFVSFILFRYFHNVLQWGMNRKSDVVGSSTLSTPLIL
jgi:hypothetical protein